jgi:hypothetical protein
MCSEIARAKMQFCDHILNHARINTVLLEKGIISLAVA